MVGSDIRRQMPTKDAGVGCEQLENFWCMLSTKAFEWGSAKEELGSSILISATSHTVNEALLLVSVPNKLLHQLQR